jgi:hypothetical protein
VNLIARLDIIKHLDDEKRYQQDAQDGDFIGGRHA